MNKDQVAAIFAEWHKQYREDPGSKYSYEEVEDLTDEEYGIAASATFYEIASELEKA